MATQKKHTAQNSTTVLGKLVSLPQFPRIYLLASLAILLVTALFWSILGAHLQADNADQLADPYMFSNYHTFHAASFPVAHTFLLKWPIFALVSWFGISAQTILLATVFCVLATLAALVYILFRIERRPLVLGTIFLGLASMLLLVPAQPYPGGLLPVNMAMLATRNLEYVFYLAALALLAKATRIRSRNFWVGAVVLSILLASDRLFLGLSAGGAILALVGYALTRSWQLVSLAARWLIATCVALVGATFIVWFISSGAGFTHIIGGGSQNSPYSATQSAKSGIEGAIFAVTGFVTNFGANPAHAATEFKQIPSQLSHNLAAIGGPAYLVNALALLFALWVSLRYLGKNMLQSYKNRSVNLDTAGKLSAMLVYSTIAAAAIYVGSKHQYAVDARYLGIGLFALCISTATALRHKQLRPERLVMAGLILCAAIVLGVFAAAHDQHKNTAALQDIHNRDQLIAQAMNGRHTQVLLGDYWRVMPAKLASSNRLSVWPLSACTQPRTVLTSEAWRPDITKHGFAYLLSLDRGLTDYPRCGLKQIIDTYGRPNASLPIAGNLSHPKELLLFYDHGIHHSSPLTPQPQKGPATVLPISTDELPNTTCDGPTIMNVVAHQDDDLLFLSPNLLHDIQSGHCVRTVYLTAGDSGRDTFYWLSRQQGAEAAYATMINSPDAWVQRIVKVSEKQYITVANIRGNSKVSLIFMNLPDGNLKGEGFGMSRNESLSKLLNGKISTMHTVDGESTYSSSELISTLAKVMHIYQPAEIRTQANSSGGQYPDHSDHISTGQFAAKAHDLYEQQQFNGLIHVPLISYAGYPIHGMPPNVSGQDLQQKEAAFFAYTKYDGATCHSHAECANTPTYHAYLTRQYPLFSR
ncbi:MAG TPA: PIG-L family deacetylase [Candidatus Saccharimonadales bacterium]